MILLIDGRVYSLFKFGCCVDFYVFLVDNYFLIKNCKDLLNFGELGLIRVNIDEIVYYYYNIFLLSLVMFILGN